MTGERRIAQRRRMARAAALIAAGAALPAAAAPGTCAGVEPDTDYSGHDARTVGGVASADACCAACLAAGGGGCRFWTWNPADDKCFLKTSDAGRRTVTGRVSGEGAAPAPPAPAPVQCPRCAGPRFSWDTVPVFYHSCNFSGPYTDAAIRIMAKFPMVTVEKGQGVADPADRRYAEDKIVDTLRRVKAIDANVSTIFYYNSAKDWPFYRLHAELMLHPEWWMQTKSGGVCRVGGDPSFPNHTDMLAFDFAQAAVRDFWASECVNMTRTGYVDGCFSDKATSTPCSGSQAFRDGHLLVHQQLQRAIGDGPLIANTRSPEAMPGVSGVQIESFKANEASIKALAAAAALGKIVEAHAGYGSDGAADDHCSKGITNSLSAFLIGAGPRSYYACSQGWKVQADPVEEAWHPEYDRPLGEPAGAAVKTGSTYRREFVGAKGTTVVTFDTKSNTGEIQWAGGPAPPPPPAPGSCDAVYPDTGITGSDVTPKGGITAPSAAECCAGCWAASTCVAWTWYTDGTRACHYHSSWAKNHAAVNRTSGRTRI